MIILFFIYGLVIGSFCNVVICRLRSGESVVRTPSHCVRCGHPVSWRDNIPVVSYLLLRGRCRTCAKKISLQYPIVEFVMGLVFASVGYFYSVGAIVDLITAIVYVFGFACLMVIVVYDWRYMEIPMGVMWGAIGLFFVANVITDWYSGAFEGSILDTQTFLYAASAAVAFCFFFGLSYVSDETWMGYGDAFIAIAIGLLLGPIGTFVALLIAFCVGAIYGVGLMVISGKSSKTEIPFGPFLIFGLYTAFVLVNIYPDLVLTII